LPSDNELLLKYVAFLYQEGLKGTSIKVYLSAVHSLHIFNNLIPPVYDDKLLLALKGAIRLTKPPDRKLPITYQILTEIFPFLAFRHDSLLLSTVMSMSFFGCFRAGELCLPDHAVFNPETHLTYKCITMDTVNRTVTVLLRSSKTDTLDQGVSVKVGCSKTPLSAYTLMSAFLEAHPRPQADSPLFMDPNQIILRKAPFVAVTKLILAMAGYDPGKYSGHSFRAGSATTGAALGFSSWELKLLGRWNSDAYNIYLRDANLVSTFAQRLAVKQA
jgi:hypothetical protein